MFSLLGRANNLATREKLSANSGASVSESRNKWSKWQHDIHERDIFINIIKLLKYVNDIKMHVKY